MLEGEGRGGFLTWNLQVHKKRVVETGNIRARGVAAVVSHRNNAHVSHVFKYVAMCSHLRATVKINIRRMGVGHAYM